MTKRTVMKNYEVNEEASSDSVHTVNIVMLQGDAVSEFNTRIMSSGGGGHILECYTSFDTGIVGLSTDPLNLKHCLFYEDQEFPTKEIESFKFFRPNGESFFTSADEAENYIVKIEIIDYKEVLEDDE